MKRPLTTDALADRILALGSDAGTLRQNDLSTYLGNFSARRIGEALDLLARRGVVAASTLRTGGRGRPATIWDFRTEYQVGSEPVGVDTGLPGATCSCVRWAILDDRLCLKCGRGWRS